MNHREFERSRIPVADTDSDYARERQEKKNIAEQEDRYFGKEFFDEHGEYNGKPLDAIPELFEGLWKKQSGLGLSILTGFSKEMLSHPKMRNTPAVQNAVRGMPSAPFAPQELLRAILMCEIPPDVMVDMLRIHRQTHEACTIYVNERLPDMRQRFLKGISRLLRAPQHPLSVEMLPYGTIERRMSEVAVVAGDELEYLRSDNGVADYHFTNNSITLLPNIASPDISNEAYLFESFSHEMFHAVAGKTIVRDKKGYTQIRQGVLFHGGFQWLDEAITEQLAIEIEGTEGRDTDAYKSERRIYSALRKQVPAEFFLRAYFENATPLNDSNRLRGQAELHRRIIDAYGFNILIHIEQLSKQGDIGGVAMQFDEKGNWKA